MPGIFGLINKDLNVIDDKTALEMASLLKHEEWHNSKWVINSCLLGVVELNTINCKNIIKDKNIELMGVSRGQIFNKDQLAKKHNLKYNSPLLNDIEFITQLYKKIGPNFAKYLKGIFNVALYDNEKDRVIVVNDRYGFYPMFYSLSNEGFTFASEAKGVLEGLNIIPEIDKNAVPEFFSFKYPLGERTFFKQVKKLQPATTLIYDRSKHRLVRQRYWDSILIQQKKHKIVDINNMLKSFKKIMKRAIKRTTQDKKEIGIFLSGGLDSTILTAFASETNSDITTYTFGHKNCSLEKQIARNVACELGVKNVFYEIPCDFITNFANKIVYQGDGLIRIRESHFISCLENIREKNDTILIGTMGGLFRARMENFYRSSIKTRLKGRKGIKEYFFSQRTKQLPLDKYPEVFNKKFYLEAVNAVKMDFNRDFNRIIGTTHIKPYDLSKLWRFQLSFSKGIAQQFQYMNWYLETRHPFLDHDVFNFALNLPLQLKERNRFLKKAMKYCFPKLCSIELEHGYPFNANPLEYYLGLFKLSTLKRIRARKTSINELDYRDYGNWLRSGSKDFVMDILDNSQSLNKYFKQEFIKKTLKDHMNGKEDKNQLICDLINLELIHREFF